MEARIFLSKSAQLRYENTPMASAIGVFYSLTAANQKTSVAST